MRSDRIIQYSMGRSGSTLITQVLKKLFPNVKVQKTHAFVKKAKDFPIIVSYRDFRDVMASGWRVNKDISFEDLDNGRQMTPEDVDTCLTNIVSSIKTLNKMCRVYSDHLVALRYEKFIDDFDYIFYELEDLFKTSFHDKKKKHIKKYSSLEVNTKRSMKFNSFHNGNWDKKTLIHGLHIYKKGKPGIWKQLVPKDKHDLVNSTLKNQLERWEYEV